jgi:diacylglycerol kinase
MKKWLSSARHALHGLLFLVQTERNFRIELFFAFTAIVAGFWLRISVFEFCIVLLCIGAVLGAEAFNSAIERLADFHTREIHPEIKTIKDIAAGAVVMLSIISLIIGLIIFWPLISERLESWFSP